MANRISVDFPLLRHNLNSINPTSIQQSEKQSPTVGDTVHISQLLSTDQSEDELDTNNFQQWFDSPTECESQYVSKDTLIQNNEWKQVLIHCTNEQELITLTKVLREHPEVFSSKLPKEPARVPPLSFTLDQSKWVTR